MKKINKPLLKEYLPVRLFLDDLEPIEELLSKTNGNYRINIEAFEFSNIKEVLKKYRNETVSNLKILSSHPYVNIEFHKMWARLYIGSDDNLEAGLFFKLDRIISSTIRRPSILYSFYFLVPSYFIFMIAKLLLQGAIYAVVYFSGYILLMWTCWVVYIRLFKYSEIIFAKRRDIQSFLARNKDRLIVGLFTVFVGAILGVVGTIIVYKLGLIK